MSRRVPWLAGLVRFLADRVEKTAARQRASQYAGLVSSPIKFGKRSGNAHENGFTGVIHWKEYKIWKEDKRTNAGEISTARRKIS